VRADRDGGQVLVSVADHGGGIAESDKRLVFEAYQRSRPGSPTAGAGVGLAIARGFVEAHGGSIEIGDTPGGGATVVVRLAAGDSA
jgi:two-component system, OmpR family, sensor histidine kinase KdpD